MDDAPRQRVTRLSGGWYMVEPMTRSMAELLYAGLDAEELDELKAVDVGRMEFVDDCLTADRSAAFFAGATLVFGIAANWVPCPGAMGGVRLWDTMSTRAVREQGLVRSFVVHTPEMRDAFMLGEPTDEVVGVVKSDFARSRKWIERCAKFKERGETEFNGVKHTIYTYREEA